MTLQDADATGEFPLTQRAGLVLDTNVVLDWLLFCDPRVRPLATAIESGRLRWLATRRMRDELADVLGRGLAARHLADASVLLQAWERLATACAEPTAAPGPRCRDPDDQPFVDLALAARARWLVSRDRALLALHRRTRPLGLAIVTPEQWASTD